MPGTMNGTKLTCRTIDVADLSHSSRKNVAGALIPARYLEIMEGTNDYYGSRRQQESIVNTSSRTATPIRTTLVPDAPLNFCFFTLI